MPTRPAKDAAEETDKDWRDDVDLSGLDADVHERAAARQAKAAGSTVSGGGRKHRRSRHHRHHRHDSSVEFNRRVQLALLVGLLLVGLILGLRACSPPESPPSAARLVTPAGDVVSARR